MMRGVVVLLALVALTYIAVASAKGPFVNEFLQFQKKYNKTYGPEEYTVRFANFMTSMRRAREEQAKNPRARFGVTKFSDLSAEEFKKYYLNARVKSGLQGPAVDFENRKPHARNVEAPNPTNYDWSAAGVVTPVYDQGQCGSCWAFSATETIESYWALAGHSLTQLSMEQVVDCDTTDGGCGGGNTETAYQYVQSAGGLDSYASYPYTAGGGDSGDCAFSSSNVVAQITGYQSISGEDGMYKQLSSSNGGPVSVCVAASTWQDYQGGVITSCDTNVDHCVQTTGYYNYAQAGAYWNVRNSWGTSWGENGFIWVAIGQDLCLIGDDVTIATI